MDTSRRSFLKGVAAGAASVAVAEVRATDHTEGEEGRRWGMVVDLRRCIGCQACTVACGTENATPFGQYRTVVNHYELEDAAGRSRSAVLPRLCNHCEDPPCVPVCPVGATWQRRDGIVLVDNSRCVGCGYCVQACPYDARFINEELGTADKCTFCVHRVDAGLLPACVETCVGAARVFGDLNDPDSTVSRLIASHQTDRLKTAARTGPQVRYIGLDGRLQAKVEGEPTPVNANIEEVAS